MKSKIFKGVILASAIAFINCGDDSATSPLSSTGDISSSSIESTAESSSSEVAPVESSSSEIAPTSSSEIAPASSTDEAPASSADALSSSSDVQSSSGDVASSSSVAQSSSSEQVSSSSEQVSSSSEAPKGIFLASGKEEEKDQLKVVYKTNTGWDNKGILAYPEQLSSDQKHGVVVWGPGGGTEPGAYEGMIRRLASHGFVVIALSVSPGDASQASKAIDWLENKNKDSNDPFYQKLELTKVGCSGHSMGGLESEQAAIKDKRVFTAFLNNSGDKNGGVIKNFPKRKDGCSALWRSRHGKAECHQGLRNGNGYQVMPDRNDGRSEEQFRRRLRPWFRFLGWHGGNDCLDALAAWRRERTSGGFRGHERQVYRWEYHWQAGQMENPVQEFLIRS